MKDSLFNAIETKYLRSYFIKKDSELGVDRIKSQRSQKSFQEKLLTVSKQKRQMLLSWKTLVSSVISSLALGALIAKFTIQPVVIYAGSRSIDPVSDSTVSSSVIIDAEKGVKVLNLYGADKHLFVKEVLSAASRSDLLVKVQQRDERLLLSVGDFRPMSKNQEKVRELLQLESSFRGQIEVEIR